MAPSRGGTAGRRTVLGLVVAVLAAVLLWWGQGDDAQDSDQAAPAETPSASPTHRFTETNTPTIDPSPEPADPSTDPASGLPVVRAADLPAEARDVLARIDEGGPFKYPDNDGVTFENREDLLPQQPMGYYREYTVESAPRVRGPMRIVTGRGGEFYWTDDHYRSFSSIAR